MDNDSLSLAIWTVEVGYSVDDGDGDADGNGVDDMIVDDDDGGGGGGGGNRDTSSLNIEISMQI